MLEIPKYPNKIKTNDFSLLNGSSTKYKTYSYLSYNKDNLIVEWTSKHFNYYPNSVSGMSLQANQPVTGFATTMAEIYIRPEDYDSQYYLEIEINPLGNLWIAKDYNKGGDRKYGLQRKFVDIAKSGVKFKSQVSNHSNKWHVRLEIPWKLLAKQFNIKNFSLHTNKRWRINLYCVRLLQNVSSCSNNQTCEFQSLYPTGEYQKPNFHVTKSLKKIILI